jgi:hypothetical protein
MENLEPPWAPGEAWKKPARMIVKLLQKPDPGDLYVDGCESIFGCKHIAQQLFNLIATRHGENAARRIFSIWCKPPTKRHLAMLKNIGLLERLDIMERPNVQRLARQIAKENELLPRKDRRGPGTTNPVALEKQIRRVRDWREACIGKGIWMGPFPPGHFE